MRTWHVSDRGKITPNPPLLKGGIKGISIDPLLGEQADFAVLGVDQKIFRIPDHYVIHELALVDFHHVNGHLAGDQLDAFQLGHFLEFLQTRDVRLVDFLFHHPSGYARHPWDGSHHTRRDELGPGSATFEYQVEPHK
jgi:hypothetical protein